MNIEELKSKVPNLKDNGIFSFGFNWESYVDMIMNEDIIERHKKDLDSIYKSFNLDIRGLDVIDIGSGSGLSSVCFERLGAKSITSLDIDKHSYNATLLTKNKFGNGSSKWDVINKSVLDGIENKYDLVYSWGVLHHTGNMFQAINIASNAVRDGGYFHVALYIDGPTYLTHLKTKQKFASLDRDEKIDYLLNYLGGSGNDWFIPDNRGMMKFHDALDWLGGLPYEVCNPNDLFNMLNKFEVSYFRNSSEGGNFVAVLRKIK
jgi:2-polyprenyl-6-hydroxyphenyl methylase/3-demethylubiquinone-9 3-methyltransferase